MNNQFTLQDCVDIYAITIQEFFKHTNIPDEGMSGEEMDKHLNYYANQCYESGRISLAQKNNFLKRHELLGIGTPGGIPAKINLLIIR